MGREFVLVHGMSHGAWAWEPLARRLETNGHHVVAMDLPGHGRRAHERGRASVETYARVVDSLTRMTPQPIRPWTERVSMQRFYAMDVPCTYVRCQRDAAVAPARAAQYAARLGVTPVDIDCAHSPVLSALDDLVKILEKIPTQGEPQDVVGLGPPRLRRGAGR